MNRIIKFRLVIINIAMLMLALFAPSMVIAQAGVNNEFVQFIKDSEESMRIFKGLYRASGEHLADNGAKGKNALCGFISRPKDAFINPKYTLDLRKFFVGELEAWGVACDFAKNLKEHFYIDIKAVNDGNHVHLDQDLFYGSGKREARVWDFKFINDREFNTTGTDVLKALIGVQEGNTAHLQYQFLVPYGKIVMHVTADNWRYMIDENTVINTITLQKFNLNIGELLIVFKRKKNSNPASSDSAPNLIETK